MLIKELRKTLSITLAMFFISAFYALPALAMPQTEDPNQLYPQKPKQSENKQPKQHASASSRPTSSSSQNIHKDTHNPSPSPQETKRPINTYKTDSHTQDTKKPDNKKPDYNRPTTPHTDINKPDTHHPDYNRPDSHHPDYNRPDSHHPDYNRPDSHHPDYNRPDSHHPNYMHKVFAPGPAYEHHRSYPYWRRSNIIFHFGGPREHFWWGNSHNISLGEYLILTMIVQSRPNLTIDEVFTLHANGYSYETICYHYGLVWYRIDRGARFKYRKMHTYSIEQGVSFWDWNDRIGY